MARSVVVLPAPDGPSTTKKAPSGTSSETPSSALTSPNALVQPLRADRSHQATTSSVCGSYTGGGPPLWRRPTALPGSKRLAGGMRTRRSCPPASTT